MNDTPVNLPVSDGPDLDTDVLSGPACLLCFEDELTTAQAAARAAVLPLAVIQRHRFPDGELRLQLPPALPSRLVLWRGLHHPNQKLVELLLAAQAGRSLGARHITLVAPYLAYMRQDMAFRPGEAVSQRIVGRFLGGLFDALITVDPHLHRVVRLTDAVPVSDAVLLSGASMLADHVATVHAQPLLMGPDEESLQWVAQAATRHGWDHAVCRKRRRGDHEVLIELPAMPVQGRAVVLMDDVVSSGQTLVQATHQLLAAGAASVDVAVTHALFAADAERHIRGSGVGAIWSTDCIIHPTNAVSVVPAVAAALHQLLGRT